MNPRKIFSYNLYMITGMLMFYMGGFILYPTENKVYGTVFLAAGVVIFFISIEKIIRSMSRLKNPNLFKDDLQILKEKNTKGHPRRKFENALKFLCVGAAVLLVVFSFLEVKLTWIFIGLAVFLLIYLWISYQMNKFNRL